MLLTARFPTLFPFLFFVNYLWYFMFYNETLANFFFKNQDEAKTSTQQLYRIYVIFNVRKKKITFNRFYIFMYLLKNRLIKKDYNNVYLVLSYLFFLKTRNIKCARIVYNSSDVTFHKNTIKKVIDNTINLSNFWDRLKKLKRPATKLSYTEHFIFVYKTKLDKYNTLGFITLVDSFYVVRAKSEKFLKVLVKVNKSLLISPKYSSSSINKYISLNSLKDFEFQFLRKNKVYNKGRYSRCRQNYRTGVYMCMYLSVVSIFGLYYWFYKFSFNFTYLWWFFISFVASFFLPKIIKYRLYEPTTLLLKFFDFFKWITLLVRSFFK